MKYFNVLLILLNFALYPISILDAQSHDFLWVNQIGGNSYDKAYSIAADDNGNSWVFGEFYGTIAIGDTTLSSNENFDVFLASFDPIGNYRWIRQFNNIDPPLLDIDVDDRGNCLVTGAFSRSEDFGDTVLVSTDTSGLGGYNNIFVAKYDFDGNNLWAFQEGGEYSEEVTGIAVHNDGSFYLGGTFSHASTFSSTDLVTKGSADIFIARYDTEGNLDWVQNAGGQHFDEGRGIAVDPQGNCLITGSCKDSLHIADTTLTGFNYEDTFTSKFSPGGDLLWVRTAIGPYVDWPWGIAVDSDGNSYITGSFEDSLVIADTVLREPSPSGDIFIIKYDPDGNLLWANRTGGEGWDGTSGIAVDNNGNCAVTGDLSVPVTFGDTTITDITAKIFTVTYDKNGDFLWVQQAYGTEMGWNFDIAADGLGNFYITGYFKGFYAYGDFNLNGFGQTDIFIAKLGPEQIDYIGGNISSPLLPQLYQNYPNPFNPLTTIEFYLHKKEFTVLKVYDILGQEVGKLVSKTLAAGKHRIMWDGNYLASGVYYYQIESGEFKQVKKMILIK